MGKFDSKKANYKSEVSVKNGKGLLLYHKIERRFWFNFQSFTTEFKFYESIATKFGHFYKFQYLLTLQAEDKLTPNKR